MHVHPVLSLGKEVVILHVEQTWNFVQVIQFVMFVAIIFWTSYSWKVATSGTILWISDLFFCLLVFALALLLCPGCFHSWVNNRQACSWMNTDRCSLQQGWTLNKWTNRVWCGKQYAAKSSVLHMTMPSNQSGLPAIAGVVTDYGCQPNRQILAMPSDFNIISSVATSLRCQGRGERFPGSHQISATPPAAQCNKIH